MPRYYDPETGKPSADAFSAAVMDPCVAAELARLEYQRDGLAKALLVAIGDCKCERCVPARALLDEVKE